MNTKDTALQAMDMLSESHGKYELEATRNHLLALLAGERSVDEVISDIENEFDLAIGSTPMCSLTDGLTIRAEGAS